MSSGWLLLVKSLRKVGGPARFSQFNTLDVANPLECLHKAIDLKLMRIAAVEPIRYSLTALGIALADGRAAIATRPGSRRVFIAYKVGQTPPDELITRMLIEAGKKPGEAVTFDLLREFSAKLAQAVRDESRIL